MAFRIKKFFVIKAAVLILSFVLIHSVFAESCRESKCRPSSCYIDTKITYTDSNSVTYIWDTKKARYKDTIQVIFNGTMKHIIRGRSYCYFMIVESSSKKYSYYFETEKLLNPEYVKNLPRGHYEILLFMRDDCAWEEKSRKRHLEESEQGIKQVFKEMAEISEKRKFLDSINAKEWMKPMHGEPLDSNAAKILDYLDRLPEL
ncbi:MAG: hypothetical protein LBU89_00500 [Fibromonadaceae bacterium]|jgi:hypothetical protein|nr:hypothetical protein [Fibromonadaceae bacterium]